MHPISNKNLNKETKNAIYFFTTAFYPLDNFSAHIINIWGKEFPTAEHAFQWKKFSTSHVNIATQILFAKSPYVVKKISETNNKKQPLTWKNEKILVMEKILRAKAKQHKDVRDILKKTNNRIIIENSPADSFWGIGPDKNGKNMVGKIWMKIRDELNKF